MSAGPVARRYAQAVFDLATEREAWDAWDRDLETVAQTFSHPDLAEYLRDPKRPLTQRLELVRQLIGENVSPLALNYAMLLVTRHRQDIAADVLRHYRELYQRYSGTAVARVTTAVPLTTEEETQLAQALGTMLGRQVALDPTVDPAILGGVVVQIGDRLMDGSVLARLRALRSELLSGSAR